MRPGRFPEISADYQNVAPLDVAFTLSAAIASWEGESGAFFGVLLQSLTSEDRQAGGSLATVITALLNSVTHVLAPEHATFAEFERSYPAGEQSGVIAVLSRAITSAILADRRIRSEQSGG
jgi:hypothetical protein